MQFSEYFFTAAICPLLPLMAQMVHAEVSDTSMQHSPHHPVFQTFLCTLLQSAEWLLSDLLQSRSDPEYASGKIHASEDSHHYDMDYGSVHHVQNSMDIQDMAYWKSAPHFFHLNV